MDPELVQEAVRRGKITQAEAAQYLGTAQPEQGSDYNPWLGGAKALGTGALKGLIGGTIGLPGSLEQLAQLGYSKATGNQPWESVTPKGLTSEYYTDPYKGIAASLMHQPQNAAERYMEAGAEGLTSMVNPVGIAGKAKLLTKGGAVLGTAMGLGGEAGREATQGSVMGSLAGMSAPALLQLFLKGRTPNYVQAAQPYLKGFTPEDLASMAARRESATTATGVPTLLNQGSKYPTTLDSIAEEVARSPEGGPVRETLRAQREAQPKVMEDLTVGAGNPPPDKLLNASWANTPLYKSIMGRFDKAYDAATQAASAGRQQEQGLTTFVNALGGASGSQKRIGLQLDLEELGRTHFGLPPDEAAKYAKGVSDTLDAFLTLGSGRPPAKAMHGFAQAAGASTPGTLFQVPWARTWVIGKAIERATLSDTNKFFARALTSPEGAKMMLDIANFGPWSNKGQAVLQTLTQQIVQANAAPQVGQ